MFQYLLVDENGSVYGTDDEEVAYEQLDYATILIDRAACKVYSGGGWTAIPEWIDSERNAEEEGNDETTGD